MSGGGRPERRLAAPLCPGNRIPAAVTSILKRFSPFLPAYSLPRSRPHVRHPPCAGAARRSRPVSTLPRVAAPGGPAGVVGVGPYGPFPTRLAAAPAGGRNSAAGPAGSPGRCGGLSRQCGISAAAEGAGLPLAEGRCSPGHGPAADAHALGAAADGVELAGNDDGIPGGVAGEGVDLTGTGGLSEREPGVGAVGGPAGDHPFHRHGRRPMASCRLPRRRRGRGDPVRKPK